ncbi:1-phosphatidylinositol 3-phosphate 5-kinase fab1 [Globisporangium polare]
MMASEMHGRTRIRRASSYGAAQNATFPITSIMSSSYQDRRLNGGGIMSSIGTGASGGDLPLSFTPTCEREMHFDERDDEDDEDESGDNDTTEDESEYPEQAKPHQSDKKKGGAVTTSAKMRRNSVDNNNNKGGDSPELSKAQKQGCFSYIKRRHSIALAFASNATLQEEATPFADPSSSSESGSNWEYAKTKHGVTLYKSKRSRCEVRGVTRVNSSVKNVMSLLAAGETTDSFAHAQKILLGEDNVLEASVLAQCVPSSASRYFHCGLKHLALKNPFGITPLDLVFLDYTDVSTTPDGKLVGYRIMESIRVPEYRAGPKYVRASLRCEVYVVRETDVSGVVEVTFASHMDPKSKYSSSKRSHWLDQAGSRLSNLRAYAEKTSFSHKLILEKGKWIKRDARHHCFVCDASFSFLRKRHNCRLCGEVTCGRCSRKLPILVDTVTTRVRVCLRCILDSRHQPDELGRSQVCCDRSRRGSVGNATYIAYDEMDQDPDQQQHGANGDQ